MNIKRLLSLTFGYFGWLANGTKIKQQRYVFVVGCGHSGTTLLLKFLGFHPDILAIPDETGWFLQRSSFKLKSDLFSIFQLLNLFFVTFVAEKTPNHVFRMNEIEALLPNSKFICMVRDPRDVVVSLMARGYSIEQAVSRWIDANTQILTRKHDKNVEVIWLEDLVADADGSMSKVFQFLELLPVKVKRRQSCDKSNFYTNSINVDHDEKKGHLARRNWQVNQPLLESTVRWKSTLSDQDLEYIMTRVRTVCNSLGKPLI